MGPPSQGAGRAWGMAGRRSHSHFNHPETRWPVDWQICKLVDPLASKGFLVPPLSRKGGK